MSIEPVLIENAIATMKECLEILRACNHPDNPRVQLARIELERSIRFLIEARRKRGIK